MDRNHFGNVLRRALRSPDFGGGTSSPAKSTGGTDTPPAADRDAPLLTRFQFDLVKVLRENPDDAFPGVLARMIGDLTPGRSHVTIGQVSKSLARLEELGLVSKSETPPRPVQGGRRRFLYSLETSGAQAFEKTADHYRLSGTPEKNDEANQPMAFAPA